MSSSRPDACAKALERELGARVSTGAEQLERCAWDYGRLIHRPPAVVVSVHSIEELHAALRIGEEHSIPIVIRGSGHSVSGQCLADGALAIDMKALNHIELEAERSSAWLSAGATWHRVTNAAFAEGLMPVGLTMIVDTTVGGTLSVGGVGGESFRTGTQVDQLLELDVATLDGKIVRCSGEHNRELFDAVRAGVGQCGIIVKARYPVRKAKANIRTYMFACKDAHTLVADLRALSSDRSIDFMFGALLWSEQRGWQQLLFVGQTFDDPSELHDLSRQGELNRADTPLWRADGRPGHPFIRLFEEQNTGALHHRPWSDHLCEPQAATELLSSVFSEPAAAPRAGTNGVVIGIAAHANRAPLLQPQTTGPLVLVGLNPEALDAQLPETLAYMQRHHKRGAAVGGKRYLSGYMDGWTAHEWALQLGESWQWFRAMKQRYDPQNLLNNSFIRWH